MKLYMHPVSMTSRPVRLFMAEKGLKADEEVVDLMTGAHFQEPYASLNPNKLVPMLDDDGFKLTESSAILKYLAEKFDLARISEGPEAARQGQRGDGLAQHQLLSRVGLRAVLPAALPAHEAAQRRGAGLHPRMGQGAVEALAAGAQRPLHRAEEPVSHRRHHHDRGLFRRRAGDARRIDRLRSRRRIRTSRAGSTT